MVHINEALTKMKHEMEKVIVGKDELVELFTIALLVNGHILLESVPGTGKTTFAKTFSQLIAGGFKRIQFTPDVLPSDVTGIQFFNPKTQEFELREGPIMTNILLADEINRATPRTQSSLLEVMEELQVTIDGETIKVEPPFMVIATQNPVESRQGTFPLPAAQMDRFFMKVDIGYPSVFEEKKMLRYNRATLAKPTVNPVLTKEDIVKLQKALNEVQIVEDVEDYLLSIIRLTREHQDIELGVSPRGSIAFLKAVQGKALISGRNYVTPSDIQAMAPYCLQHRIHLKMESSLAKTPLEVLNDILSSVTPPVEVEM